MKHNVVTVLKKDQVQVSGSVRLAVGGGLAPVRMSASGQSDSHASLVPQEARVIESNSDYAVIEVICGCGSKMHIQCNYGDISK